MTSQVIEMTARRGDAARGRWRVDIQSVHKGTLAEHLGIRFVEVTPERVVAELDHRPALTTVGGALHGGTLMALADTVGAAATFLNLPAGARRCGRRASPTRAASSCR